MASNGATGAAATAMAAPAWRQFQFFSQTPIRDHHAPSSGSPEILRQPALISTLHADEELMLLADLDGRIHQLSPDYEVLRSWRAYGDGMADGRCTLIRTVRGWKGVVITLGEDPSSPFPTIKIWSLSTSNTTTPPTLLRSARINPTTRPHPVSSLALAPGLTHIVLGLADGTVVAFRHVDQLVEASLAGAGHAAVNGAGTGSGGSAGVLGLGKLRVLYEGKEPITDLGIAGMGAAGPSRRGGATATTLFILTTSHVLSYPITSSSSKASATVLDDLGSGVGCSAVMRMAGGEKMVVARDEAIYVYGAEGREGCYAYEGPKSAIRVLSSSISSSPSSSSRSTYLAIVSPPLVPTAASTSATIRNYARGLLNATPANGAGAGGSSPTDVAKVTIFDPENKFVAHSGTFEEGVREVWEAWGSVWVLSEGGKLFRLSEQPLATSLSTLFSRNLYTLAVSLAQSRKLSPSEVAEIYRRYGDHLYSKSDYEGAMGCYLKTVGTVQASYVIRKFLDAQRLSHLTSYLQELHSRGLANSDHTTLLLNCYTKLADDTALSSFIHSSSTSGSKQRLVPLPDSSASSTDASDEPPFDLETAIRVCRQAGYFEHAVWLAERYGEHQEYLRIQIEDRADFGDALAYLRRLGTEVAKDSLVRYGKTLLAAEPKATTALLIDLCCGTLSKGKEPESSEEEKENGVSKKAGGEGKGYMSLLAYGTSAEPSLPPPAPSTSPAPPPPLAAGPRSNANELRANESAANNRKSGITNQYQVPDSIPSPAPPIEEDVPSPRQFFAHYVDHPHDFINFLETIAERRYGKKVDDGTEATPSNAPLPKPQPLRALEFDDAATRDEQAVWNTLLELYVSHGSAGSGDHSEVVLQAKALRLLRARERIPYDETQALLVCSTQGFVQGFILLYEQLGMYDDIVRYWIDSSQASSATSSDSSKVIQALHRYGPSHPHLYRMVLRYLTTSSDLLSRHQSDIAEILDDIDRDKILPPIAVVQILSTNGTASIGLVREYLKKQLTAEKQEIDSDQGLIASYRTESAKKRKEIQELSDPNVPRIFQVTRCSACGGQLDLPAVHFMCRHSYHQRCLGENESQCPNCARTHGVVREIRKNNEQFAGRHDLFLGEVAESEDGFATIAAAFSKGMGLAGSAGDS
ncbi:hypothetical protein BCR35DRAFT_288786 [Leucosporidium creatinivorum]|uniref:RING-type domain-containing protein n=1 Tax=Leucosporidium creatinivorum TaxID=106004 RepID=A0A1Y2FX09_9BASI|nr:hypothetical protein BCR35DRAFT_288786 [Leucosporidium creatinivorum]